MSKLAPTLALLAVLAPLPESAGARDGGFDGTWSVELVTESGLCEARYSYSLSVQDGQVRPVARAGANGATLTGRVGTDGAVGLTMATSAASGAASGRLKAATGSGTWNVSALCSGRWSARRLVQRTAQVETRAE